MGRGYEDSKTAEQESRGCGEIGMESSRIRQNIHITETMILQRAYGK